ncbi:uncharacterized protein [Triticum aestivum]|uniref:uncharacterized protein n=1 Tax=Triticum aestivum TaxID=4565 RepID=UPI001D02FA3B|nr:uncharacterized protein LOC123104443 [Triticum aestivum]XP_044382227.1 uncharacterized protein LOC123104443 [Triticum aestivum]
MFSVEIHHSGFFCGSDINRTYMDYEVDWFDNCQTDTWSLLWIDDFLLQLGYDRQASKIDVYWCEPRKTVSDGLKLLTCDADIVLMICATLEHKNLLLIVDHGDTLQSLNKDDVLTNGVKDPPKVITTKRHGKENVSYPEKEQSPREKMSRTTRRSMSFGEVCSSRNAMEEENIKDVNNSEEEGNDEDAGSEIDEEFYESDYEVAEGDDDLFDANIDKDVDDHKEKNILPDFEEELPEDALEDSHLNMSKEEKEKLKHKFSTFNPTTDLNAPVFKIGLVFADMKELRHALTAYSVRNRVKVNKLRNTSVSLEAVCKPGCTWYLKAGKDNRSSSIQIKKYVDNHTYTKEWDLRVLTAPFLTNKFREEFRDNEKMPLKKFSDKVETEYNLVPHRSKLGRARRAAVNQIRGVDDDQYNTLWDYGQELRRSNPGSQFFLCTKEVFDEKTKKVQDHFSTLYWSYDACKRGFLKGCRPIIFLDGCHIKTRYKGTLLIAVGIDPNDCIFPVAFGLCEVESTHSWEWFLASLKDDLNIMNTSPYTIMSDKQKGLINAAKKVFPHSEHRNCVRHIYQNFHKVHKGEQLKNDLWSIARSTNEAAYTRNMDLMKEHSLGAYTWVEKLEPRTWIKAFFDPFCKCDTLLNNMSEVFNSYILYAREMPIKSMLDQIMWKLTNRIVGKQREAEKWTGRLCPKIQKKLDKYVEWAKNCRVQEYGQGVFKVFSLNNTYIVDLNMLSCECKRWVLSGIPCHHAIACFRHERIEPESMVHSCYTIEEYKKCYGFNMMPMRDPQQ